MKLVARLWFAIVCFFRIAFDARFAAKVAGATRAPAPLPEPPDRATPPAIPTAQAEASLARNEQALQLLSMLQREGRLIDFCEEEIAGVPDAQLGAAARTVHDGCRKALRSAFELLPVRGEPEGAALTLPVGFDPRAVRITGNLVGSPPFAGVLRHHGWRAGAIRMPNASGDPTLLAPAEVELP
ncbi:MAG TPA: DUF2760 domain-containing protein [Myxococcales bacterium]|nr:DUF2760 domain-containing protein [Myxococcales bacterium]